MNQDVPRLLLVEDNAADSVIVRELLAEMPNLRVEIDWVKSYEAAAQALATGNYTVCLLDYGLGVYTGLDLLKHLGRGHGTPVIVLTGNEDYRVDASMAEAGAADYLIKRNLDAGQLDRSIRYAIQRKANADSLLKAQRLTQSIVDSLPEKIAVLDAQGSVVALNAAWTSTGDAVCFPGAGAAVGANFLAAYEGHSDAAVRDIASSLRAVLTRHSEESFATEFSCHQGQATLWVELCATPLTGSDPALTMVAFKNITQRHEVEAELRSSRSNLTSAQEIASLGSWEIELLEAGRAVGRRFWSDETYRILGYKPNEVEPTYEAFRSVIHPDDLAAFEFNVARSRENFTSFVLDHRLLMPDGSVRVVQERVGHVFDASGVPIKLLGTLQDITGRSQEEAQARFHQTLLQAQTDASLDGILVISPEGKVLSYNQQFIALWGIPEDVMNSKDDDTIVHSIYDKLADPDSFRAKIHYLYGHTAERSQDEVVFADGRVFDRYSAPVTGLDGFYYGRVWYFRDITERKRAEEELEKSNREILSIWESMTDAFYTVDLEWRFTRMNSQAAALLRLDAKMAIGQNMWDLFPDAKSLKYYREFGRAIEEQTALVFEEYYAPLDLWTEIHAYPSPIGLSVYFHDISNRKRAEAELRASEERFEGIIANVPGMVFQFVPGEGDNFNLPFVSKGSVELYGVAPEAIINDSKILTDMTSVEDREEFFRSAREAVSNQAPWLWEGRRRLPSGEVKWIQAVSHPRELADGSILWDGLQTDITARKVAEEERDRFFTMSLDMLAIVGQDSRLKRFNPAFEQTLGYTADELRATPLLDYVHPDDLTETIAHMARFESGMADLTFTNRNICKDGSVKWLSWHAVLWEGLFYVVAHDITPVTEAQAALQRSNEELESKVAERTRELATANEDLRVENVERQMTTGALREVAEAYRVAQEQSDAASKAKSEFLSRMSHELRTPLNAILGFGEILQGGDLTTDQKEQVGQILHGGWHLLGLINEILDISRVETGDLDLLLESVSVADIVSESCSLISPLAAQRSVILEIASFSDADCYVKADRQRLKQVIINLLSNGIKYNRLQGRVTVSWHVTTNGRVRISVRDTGRGLSKQDIEKLFIPFERLGAMDSAVEGTGLGLVLSKHLITAMGGRIDLESTPGQGSTFMLELAQSQADEKMPQPIGSGEVSRRSPGLPARSHLVLSIEDNPSNQNLLQQILAQRPEISLMAAASGKLGLSLAAGHRPDLILLNLSLPDIPGEEVLHHLRQNPATQAIPIIVVSADATQSRVERLLNAGANSYLTKPYGVSEILDALDQALNLAVTVPPITKPPVLETPIEEIVPASELCSLRVLVAEDNLVNQKVVSMQLTKLGHQPFVCANGQELVDTWKRGGYDVILMDCQMPVMDGYAATREIRSLENGKAHIPIIALTANALAEDREKSLASGMDDHLSKPVKQAELRLVLARNCV